MPHNYNSLIDTVASQSFKCPGPHFRFKPCVFISGRISIREATVTSPIVAGLSGWPGRCFTSLCQSQMLHIPSCACLFSLSQRGGRSKRLESRSALPLCPPMHTATFDSLFRCPSSPLFPIFSDVFELIHRNDIISRRLTCLRSLISRPSRSFQITQEMEE